MNPAIRAAIARIDVVQDGRSISRGTGTLVAEGLVLTALHVVADRRQEPPASLYPGEITLTFPGFTTKATLHEHSWDRITDWVLLQCETGPPILPAPLAILEESSVNWETYGFPDANPRDGMVQVGSVTNCLGELENCRVLQLFSDQAAAGAGAPVKGLSGGPVLVQDALVGVLRFALMSKESMTVAGTLYACPVASVLQKCGDLLPIPDPCFGLPGLPRQPLPGDPFRYLARFAAKDAEVFFGRNREIRQLYDRLTRADSPRLTLLYGQSGVGKSSFLDAGVVPRLQWNFETLYLRRDRQRSLLDTLWQSLDPGNDLPSRWLATEKRAGKPLVVFFDQIEETYTLPCATAPNEVRDFIAAIRTLPGRLVLSFRKEWFPEIQKQVEEAGIDYGKVFLEALGHDAILEVVNGLTATERLRSFYNLTIQPELPETIAGDLSDRNSPIAPTLQILLTKLWRSAIATDAHAPKMSVDLYRELREAGLLLGDFLDQQIDDLAKDQPGVVESGLALDTLAYHTTALLTARQHSRNELLQTYAHQAQVIPGLIAELERLFLFSDDSSDGAKVTRLTHDTLAPLVRSRFDRSIRIGQRARRIVESRVDDWDGSDAHALDGPSLELVESGLDGMRALTPREQALLEASRRRHTEEQRRTRILRSAAIAAVAAITLLAGIATLFYFRAREDAAIAELRYRAARAENTLALRPLPALIESIGLTADSLQSQKAVLPIVQLTLSDALVQSLETNGILGSNIAAAALSPDGLSFATARLQDRVEQVQFFDRTTKSIGAIPDPIPAFSTIAPLAYSPNGDLLAIGGAGTRVWNIPKHALSGPFADSGAPGDLATRAVAFTPDGDFLLTGHDDGMMRVWSLDGRLVSSVQASGPSRWTGNAAPPASRVRAIVSVRGPKGEIFVITGGDDGLVKQFQLQGGALSPVAKLDGASGEISCLAARVQAGKLEIASGSSTGAVWLWSDGQGAPVYYFDKNVTAVALSPTENLIAAAGSDNSVRFFDLTGTQIAPPYLGFEKLVHSLHFFPDGSLLASGPGAVRLFDTSSLGGGRHIPALDGSLTGVAFLRGGQLVAGTPSGDLTFWYPETNSARQVRHSQGGPFTALTANRQGTLIAAGTGDGRVHLFDPQGNMTAEFNAGSCISKLRFSPDGKMLAARCSGSGDTMLWDIAGNRQRAVIRGADEVFSFNASGESFGAVSPHGKLRLWRLDGTELPAPSIQTAASLAMAFRPDGRGLAIGDANGNVWRWKMSGDRDKRPLQTSRGPAVWVGIARSPASLYIVTATGIGVLTYPAEMGVPVEATAVFDSPRRIDSAALSVENDFIATNGAGGVRLWPADWHVLLREACHRLENHVVFHDPSYTPTLDPAIIARAHQVCQSQ